MRIISNFKDYYDHIAHIYGGGDPKIVYVRKDLLEPERVPGCGNYYKTIDVMEKSELSTYDPFSHARYGNHELGSISTSYLSVCGRCFLLVCEGYHGKKTFYKNSDQAARYLARYMSGSIFRRDSRLDGQYNGSVELPELIRISQQIKAPIFEFDLSGYAQGKTMFRVNGQVPNLSRMGLASHYPAQQLYQDLSYFMGNTINGSPDLDPPVLLTDKERIVQHGFDLKTSFRGK